MRHKTGFTLVEVAGGDRDHRDFGCALAAGGAGSAGSSAAGSVR